MPVSLGCCAVKMKSITDTLLEGYIREKRVSMKRVDAQIVPILMLAP